MVFLLLVLGMVLLMKGADLFVDGSASVAHKLKVPSVIIGLTIVALGTSLPEASVSITAGLMGSNEIAISNIVGSNIFNTLVVVGTSAVITPFLMDKDILNRDLKINILVSILLSIFVLNGMLNRFEGIIFLVGLVLFILNLIRSAKKNRVEDEKVETLSGIKCLIYIVIGVTCIIWGGDITSKLCGKMSLAEVYFDDWDNTADEKDNKYKKKLLFLKKVSEINEVMSCLYLYYNFGGERDHILLLLLKNLDKELDELEKQGVL